MVNITSERKGEYYAALHTAQMDGNLRPFVELLLGFMAKDMVLY
jgi:hypothetical protein